MIFPYDKIKNAYSCWHITPIQIVAELRDPNKLKKPKRPDLIQAQAALPLPYRNNPADLAINGFPYDTTSDEESDHKSRLMMDIKREPVDMINESMVSQQQKGENLLKELFQINPHLYIYLKMLLHDRTTMI